MGKKKGNKKTKKVVEQYGCAEKYSYANEVKRASNVKRTQQIVVAIMAIIAILAIAFGLINENLPRTYAVKDVRLCQGWIAEITIDEAGDKKNYVKVRLTTNEPPEAIKSDDLWIAVSDDFYLRHAWNDNVAVVIGKCDVFKPRLFSKSQAIEKSYWEVQEIFDSRDEALQKYPQRSFTAEAVLIKKKVLKDGSCYFVLNYDDRSYVVKVAKKEFDRASLKDKVKCRFEALGDFVKLTRLLI